VREAAASSRPAPALKNVLVTPITRHMKALDRPLVRPLLIVLLAALAWTLLTADIGARL
jgi:hypothetical protein